MNKQEAKQEASEIISNLCNGDEEAISFCADFFNMAHKLDDIYDCDVEPTEVEGLSADLVQLTSHPFYLKNHATLNMMLKLSILTWSMSNAGMESKHEGYQHVGDITRISGNDIILAVALLFNPIQACIEPCLRLRFLSYCLHHDENNKPI